jgi:hypothetical protein
MMARSQRRRDRLVRKRSGAEPNGDATGWWERFEKEV